MNVWDGFDEFAPSPAVSLPVSRQGSTSSLRSLPNSPHHPLKSRPVSLEPAPRQPAFASASQPLPGSTSADIRSRRTTANGTIGAGFTVDADVTRPSLKRVTDKERAATGAAGAGGGTGGLPSSKSRTSLDELVREATPNEGERDVVVHQVSLAVAPHVVDPRSTNPPHAPQLVKSDTIASISLQYGITVNYLFASHPSNYSADASTTAPSVAALEPTLALGLDPPAPSAARPAGPVQSAVVLLNPGYLTRSRRLARRVGAYPALGLIERVAASRDDERAGDPRP